MVQALLAGKTQTRRLVTVPWHKGSRALPYEPACVEEDDHLMVLVDRPCGEAYAEASTVCRPYGTVVDLLWVRETFAEPKPGAYIYLATAQEVPQRCRWKPSIHMPRAASRITLQITGHSVERLQSITESDAQAEGVTSVEDFAALWDTCVNTKAYPDAAWIDNPWVHVVAFARVLSGSRACDYELGAA